MHGGMQVFMKPPTGKTITLDVGALALTDTLKAKVLTKRGVPVDQQRRAFGGRQLEDGRALAEYNIQNGSVIDLASRLRGGALGDDRNANQNLTSGAAGNGNGGNDGNLVSRRATLFFGKPHLLLRLAQPTFVFPWTARARPLCRHSPRAPETAGSCTVQGAQGEYVIIDSSDLN